MASQSQPFSPPPPYSSYTNIPIFAIAILGILTTAILLLSYYIFVIKCCMNWRQSEFLHHLFQSHSTRGRNNHNPSPFTIYASTTITTRGLGESAIRAIPIIRFGGLTKDQGCGSKKRFIQECSVCLSEFKDEEWLRILPNCSHAFHVDCIDTWLQTNSNCPFCRSEITNSDIFMSCEDQSMSVVINVEADVNTIGSCDLAPRTEASVASTAAQQNLPLRRLENGFEFGGKKVRKLNQVCSMGDECINVREKDEEFCSLQPIRRSISMDSSTDRQLYVAVQEILRQKQNLQFEREEGSSSGSFRIRTTLFGNCRSCNNVVLPIHFDS